MASQSANQRGSESARQRIGETAKRRGNESAQRLDAPIRPRRRLWRRHQSLFYALHPDRIPAASLRFTYTFGLGGLAFLAALIAIGTGVLLAFYYAPTPDQAHASVVLIEDVVAWGSLVRALHYWSAQVAVIAATLHMARVVFTGAYARPRRFNWLIGLSLLVLLLLWDFSGYVLRWDEGAYWALLVGVALIQQIPFVGPSLYLALVGDTTVGAATLLRFSVWHIIGLTLVVGFGVAYHLFRLQVDGGISRPPRPPGQPRLLASKDDLIRVEAIATLIAVSGLIALAALAPAPLGPAADLAQPPADVMAPWIFLWVQRLLRWIDPVWAGVALPALLLLFLATLPWLDAHARAGVWFHPRQRAAHTAFLLLALALVALSLWEALS